MPVLLDLTFRSDLGEVRLALAQVCNDLAGVGTQPDVLGQVELVLAEVLNNVVEHAYADGTGDIALEIRLQEEAVQCRVSDSGTPMPGGVLPAAPLPRDIPGELPEGGFGWHLIRTLSRNLNYARRGGQNILTFHIPLSLCEEPAG